MTDNKKESNIPEYQDFMDLEEVAKYLKVSMSSVYLYINLKENPLPSYKISKKVIRVRREELDEWIVEYRKKNNGK